MFFRNRMAKQTMVLFKFLTNLLIPFYLKGRVTEKEVWDDTERFFYLLVPPQTLATP